MGQFKQGQIVDKGMEGPAGEQEQTRSRLATLAPGRVPQDVDSNRLTGGMDQSKEPTEYPTSREPSPVDSDQSTFDESPVRVRHNHSRPVNMEPRLKNESGYRGVRRKDTDTEEEEKTIDPQTGTDSIKDQTSKSVDPDRADSGTPEIDADSTVKTDVEPLNDLTGDPREFLALQDPTVTQTSGRYVVNKTDFSRPDGAGEWPCK